MENHKITLNGDEVLSVNHDDNILMGHNTYKVEELLHAIGNRIDHHKKDKWCIKGVTCQILTPNQSWQKGKVKISLEFIPDQVESPLDRLRKEM